MDVNAELTLRFDSVLPFKYVEELAVKAELTLRFDSVLAPRYAAELTDKDPSVLPLRYVDEFATSELSATPSNLPIKVFALTLEYLNEAWLMLILTAASGSGVYPSKNL